MVSIKEATESAAQFAREALGADRTGGLRLEEIESALVNDHECWLITLSMIRPDAFNAIAALNGREKREYKTFTVRKNDGEVLSMKIRELADA